MAHGAQDNKQAAWEKEAENASQAEATDVGSGCNPCGTGSVHSAATCIVTFRGAYKGNPTYISSIGASWLYVRQLPVA
jgi:hypothetical protein